MIKPFDYRSRYTDGRQPSKRAERFINNLPRLTSGEGGGGGGEREKKKFVAPISLSHARESPPSLITDSYGIISFLISSSSSFSFQGICIISSPIFLRSLSSQREREREDERCLFR